MYPTLERLVSDDLAQKTLGELEERTRVLPEVKEAVEEIAKQMAVLNGTVHGKGGQGGLLQRMNSVEGELVEVKGEQARKLGRSEAEREHDKRKARRQRAKWAAVSGLGGVLAASAGWGAWLLG